MLQSGHRRKEVCVCVRVCVSGLWMSQANIQVMTFCADGALDPCFFLLWSSLQRCNKSLNFDTQSRSPTRL